MHIREATSDDLGMMLYWASLRHRGSCYRHVPFSEKRAANLLAYFVTSPNGLLVVAEQDGERVGGLAANIVDSHFMEGKVAMLWSLYADDGHGGRVTLPLLRRYVEWAVDHGANLIEANNSASMDDQVFMRICGRLGFKRSGSHAHLEV